jgi:hypothetical protein
MDGADSDVQRELAALEAEEARVSAERRRLHQQIDFGYASETTRAHEREVSNHRRELHRRIDVLRELLGMPLGPPRASAATGPERIPGHKPIGDLERIGDGARDEATPPEHEYM